jgi:nucleolin
MASKVYAGKLSWDTTDETLLAHCSEFSATSAKVEFTTRLYNGVPRSKGWGLVEFKSVEDAEAAIAGLNNSELDGRTILMRLDRGPTPPSTNPPKSKGPSTSSSTPAEPSNTLFCGNLAWTTTAETLGKRFADVGSVVSAEIMMSSRGRSKGWGIVEMGSTAEAQTAIDQLRGTEIEGREISVEFKRATPEKKERAPRPPKTDQGDGKQAAKKNKPRKPKFSDEPADPSNRCFIGNLAWSVDNSGLAALFGNFNVTSAEVQYTGSNRSRGYGIVTFSSQDEAWSAIEEMNGHECEGRNIVVRYDKAR